MTSLDKLNVSQLPPHEAFYSTLKNQNISAEDYQPCQRVWEDNDMKTMKEFLTWYNNKDVEPLSTNRVKKSTFMALTSYFPVLKPTTGSSCRYCSNCCLNWYR
jgi:hypothetical protein